MAIIKKPAKVDAHVGQRPVMFSASFEVEAGDTEVTFNLRLPTGGKVGAYFVSRFSGGISTEGATVAFDADGTVTITGGSIALVAGDTINFMTTIQY